MNRWNFKLRRFFLHSDEKSTIIKKEK